MRLPSDVTALESGDRITAFDPLDMVDVEIEIIRVDTDGPGTTIHHREVP